MTINEPRVWWVQGTCGNFTHAGGTIRVFGDALAALQAGAREPAAPDAAATAALESKADRALKEKDYSALAWAATELLKLGRAEDRVESRLRLEREGTAAIVLTALPGTTSQYHAEFVVPARTPPGDYNISYAEGSEDDWVPISFFESPSRPHVRQITVRELAAVPGVPAPYTIYVTFVCSICMRIVACGLHIYYTGQAHAGQSFQADTQCQTVPSRVINVADFANPLMPRVPQHSGALPLNAVNATAGLNAALSTARSHGGGTVFFPRGTYYLAGTFEIPTNTYLKGAGTSLVTIFWAEANSTHHPSVLFTGDPKAESITWGISDVTIYATAYAPHSCTIHCSCCGFACL